MNAYELMEAAFDNNDAEETVKHIQQYADGAFNIYVSD